MGRPDTLPSIAESLLNLGLVNGRGPQLANIEASESACVDH
jgi:hypothetical protein